jgi:hypothetical protein
MPTLERERIERPATLVRIQPLAVGQSAQANGSGVPEPDPFTIITRRIEEYS